MSNPRSAAATNRALLVSLSLLLMAGLLMAGAGPGCARIAPANHAPPVDGGPKDGVGESSACVSLACTPDNRGVTDCKGNVVKTCADSQSCQGGTCVEACELARRSGDTLGCDFYAAVPPSTKEVPMAMTFKGCFAAMLANTWDAPISIKVEYAGRSLDATQMARLPSASATTLDYPPLPKGQLPPGQMAIVFLSEDPSHPCPARAGITMDPAIEGTGRGSAFHITTSAPVVAYDIHPFGAAESYLSSATLLIPTSAWGTNYVAADGYQTDPLLAQFNAFPSVQVVGAENDTQITISPTAPILGGTGVLATATGVPRVYDLSRGELLQFAQSDELAGSVISATKPVGVWGGSAGMNIPIDMGAADAAHQQLVPVNLLGFEYAAVRHRDRLPDVHESVPWTLIGTVDGTVLAYDPEPPPGAPTSINRGQMVRFDARNEFTVRSPDNKHPFYLAGHMTGCLVVAAGDHTDDSEPYCPGDPETVNTVPPAQWLKSYLFLTDLTYRDTSLVFVRQKLPGQPFRDVTLDCAGTLTGWQPIGLAGVYEFKRVDLVIKRQGQGTCRNGVHTARSDAPFGLTVWGWDDAVSYAYPGGMGVQKINDVIVIP